MSDPGSSVPTLSVKLSDLHTNPLTQFPPGGGMLIGYDAPTGRDFAEVPVTVLASAISLLLTTLGLPANPDESLNGTTGQTAITPTSKLAYLTPGSGFTDTAPAPYTLINGTTATNIFIVNLGPGVAQVTAAIDGSPTNPKKIYPNGSAWLQWSPGNSSYRQVNNFDPGIPVTSLPAAATIQGADVVGINQLSTTNKDVQTTVAALADFINRVVLAPIGLTGNVTISALTHNKVDLWATTSLTMTFPTVAALGTFRACLYTAPGATVTFAGTTLVDLGGNVVSSLAPAREMEIKTYGNTLYGIIRGATASPPTNASTVSTSPSSASVASGGTITYTFQPNGFWQSGQTIGLTLNGITGSIGSAVNGAISGSGASWTVDPTDGNSNVCTVVLTVSNVGGTNGTMSIAGTGITATTTSVAITVTSTNATSFNASPTSITLASNASAQISLTPNGGGWGSTQTATLSPITVAGTFAAVSGCTVSSNVVTPTAGSGSPAVVAFTAISANGTSGSITVAGTNVTANTTSISVSVAAASYPHSPTNPTGTFLKRAFDFSNGLLPNSNSGTTVTGLTEATGSGDDLTASVGVSVSSTTINGNPGLSFASTLLSANSGLRATPTGSPTWPFDLMANGVTNNSFAFILVFRTKATLSANVEWLFSIETPNPYYQNRYSLFWYGATGIRKLYWRSVDSGAHNEEAINPNAEPAPNTVQTVAIRYSPAAFGTMQMDAWWNGVKAAAPVNASVQNNSPAPTDVAFGQAATTAVAGTGLGATSWLAAGGFVLHNKTSTSIVTDADVLAWVHPVTGFCTTKWGTPG